MEAAQFSWLLKDLEMMFGLIDSNEGIRNWKVERYYEALKDINEIILKRAVKYVIETHKYKRFPYIGDITDAIEMIKIEPKSIEDDDDPFPCRRCDGFGWCMVSAPLQGQEYSSVSPCDCSKGRLIKKAWKNWKKIRQK